MGAVETSEIKPLSELDRWLCQSKPYEWYKYATARTLSDTVHTQKLQLQLWEAYENRYVWLFQKRIGDVLPYYEYYAVRTKLPYLK